MRPLIRASTSFSTSQLAPTTDGSRKTPFPHSTHMDDALYETDLGHSDGMGNKPWADNTAYAAKDFWKAQPLWEKTWGQGTDRGMTVKSVKMWQEGKCNQ